VGSRSRDCTICPSGWGNGTQDKSILIEGFRGPKVPNAQPDPGCRARQAPPGMGFCFNFFEGGGCTGFKFRPLHWLARWSTWSTT
jgi:hypothetical protein